ncbi:MAG: hypothetical protein V1494_06960 [Candidatus Diapherotrites archaeon]
MLVEHKMKCPWTLIMPGEKGTLITHVTGKEGNKAYDLYITFTLTGPHEKKENFKIMGVRVCDYDLGLHSGNEPEFSADPKQLTESAHNLLIEEIHKIAVRKIYPNILNFESGLLRR